MIVVAITTKNKVETLEVFNELNFGGVAEHVNNLLYGMSDLAQGIDEMDKELSFEDVRDACQQGSLHLTCENVVININTI